MLGENTYKNKYIPGLGPKTGDSPIDLFGPSKPNMFDAWKWNTSLFITVLFFYLLFFLVLFYLFIIPFLSESLIIQHFNCISNVLSFSFNFVKTQNFTWRMRASAAQSFLKLLVENLDVVAG